MIKALNVIGIATLLLAGCSADTVVDVQDAQVVDGIVAHLDSGSTDMMWAVPQRRVCEGEYLSAEQRDTPEYTALIEVSGIVASLGRTDLLWMHNDSGGEPVLYSVGRDGRRRGRLTVPGQPLDWEDLATARCPDGAGACLWIGDVGDNGQIRDSVELLVVREPEDDGDHSATQIWRYPVRYPDGPINSEAIMVSPDGDRFWLIEKVDAEQARIYEHSGPLVDGQMETLRLVVTIQAPGIAVERGRMITGADLHATGTRLLIRTYTGSFEYVLPSRLEFSGLGNVAPRTVAFGPISEPQGEAIAYDETGAGVWTISEDPTGEEVQPLNHYGCSD